MKVQVIRLQTTVKIQMTIMTVHRSMNGVIEYIVTNANDFYQIKT